MNFVQLNPMQQQAVRETEGPLLILAGAGAGKTRVLTHRIAYLIEEKGVNPWNILAITFTNKAAKEMKERVEDQAPFGSDVWVSTFHSMCVRILRRYIDRIGYAGSFVIYDTDDQKSIMKEICKKLNIDTKKFRERAILATISSAKNRMVNEVRFEKEAMGDYAEEVYAAAYKEYQKTLIRNNALDFDDLLLKTVELFAKCPEVLEAYQERFRYIMVDEYQDTNLVQFEIVRLLSQKYRNLCVVGDDDQSIYRFRGADIRNILEFEKHFPDVKVIKLEQNYRSTKEILAAANKVIRNNTWRKEKHLWTENEDGRTPIFQQCPNGFEEAEFIALDIAMKHKAGVPYQDFAVLYRTNMQSRMLEEKLIRENIPYRVIGSVNFYGRKEIKDLLSYLKVVNSGQDDLSTRRIINVPRRGIGATTLNRVNDYAQENNLSLFDAMCDWRNIPGMGKPGAKIEGFVNLIMDCRKVRQDNTIRQLLDEVIDRTGYVEELRNEKTTEAEDRIGNIEELVSKAADFDRSHPAGSLNEFLEEVALIADIDTLNESKDYVVLMTLHSSKGLEFPHVYMAGMEEGLFPGYMATVAEDPMEMEEERRLCYVGITRAMKSLTMTASKMRMTNGEVKPRYVSRFVKELGLFQKKVYSAEGGAASPTVSRKESFFQNRQKTVDSYKAARNDFRDRTLQKGISKAKNMESLGYEAGDTVKHVKFGVGKVLEIKDGGKDFEVTLEFEKFGKKKMFAAFAKLEKI